MLVSEELFKEDLANNLLAMKKHGIKKGKFFLPPFEWYNDSISIWTVELGMQLINYTPGTLSHADYTIPADENYRTASEIFHSIVKYEQTKPEGLNGFMLLMHIGSDPARTDKLHKRLPELLRYFKSKGYQLVTINSLLQQQRSR